MAQQYTLGQHRLFYIARSFQEGVDVTADLVDPRLQKHSDLSLVEYGNGLYVLFVDFNIVGLWVGTFYEGGSKTAAQFWHVTPPVETQPPSNIHIPRR